MERRAFLRVMAGLAAAGILPRSPWGGAMAVAADGPYGPLGPADANGIMLPAGTSSHESQVRQRVAPPAQLRPVPVQMEYASTTEPSRAKRSALTPPEGALRSLFAT